MLLRASHLTKENPAGDGHLSLGWPESLKIHWQNPSFLSEEAELSPPAARTLSRKRTLELFEIGDRPAGEDMMRLGRPSCLLFFRIRVEMRAQQSQGMHPDAYMRAWHNAEKRQRAENLVYLFSAQSRVINVVGTISTHLWLAIAQHKPTRTMYI